MHSSICPSRKQTIRQHRIFTRRQLVICLEMSRSAHKNQIANESDMDALQMDRASVRIIFRSYCFDARIHSDRHIRNSLKYFLQYFPKVFKLMAVRTKNTNTNAHAHRIEASSRQQRNEKCRNDNKIKEKLQ